jgi:glyoxylase-like metal-dependent hydrolase (beta-lactamase superfamily II)
MQVAAGIHHYDTGIPNWYIVAEAGRLTVVDAGFPGHFATFLLGLSDLSYRVQDVDAIVLTHIHADHTGFAERLRRISGATVWVHANDLPRAQAIEHLPPLGLRLQVWRPHVRQLILRGYSEGAGMVEPIAKARPFRDGERLDVPGRPRIIHTPGHTPGEVALYLEERNVLFSGDALLTMNLLSGRHTGPQLPYRYVNSNHRQAQASLSRLAELGQLTLLSGHGRPWVGSMHEAIGLARERLRRGMIAQRMV